jgi:uncharacterized protein YqgC (DUF456 family)
VSGPELLVALAIAVGLVGIVVPVLPGSVLILGAILVWAWSTGGTTAWLVFSTQWVGAALGVVGFFVIPVVGLFVGFVLGVYLAEYRRLGGRAAWPSTVHSLQAVGLSILIELGAGFVATCAWVTGVVLT